MKHPLEEPDVDVTGRAHDYLDVAREIADRLVERAVWHEGLCTWLGYDVDRVDGQWSTIYRTIDESLYDGLPGVALFLAELWSVTRDPPYAQAAAGAVRQALWLLRRRRSVSAHGFYSGTAGMLWAIREVERRIESDLDDGSCRSLEKELMISKGDGRREFDLVDGFAGTITGLLALRSPQDREAVVETCQRLAVRLIETAREGPGVGLSWRSADSDSPTRYPLCGLAHGASSAALALLELWSVSGEERYREIAFEGFRYERQWFNRLHGNWPDLRDLTGPRLAHPEELAHPTYWCYGAGGIGLSRLRAYQLTGEKNALAEANAALFACKRQADRLLREAGNDRDFDLNASVCHGLGSLIDLLLYSGRLSHDEEALPLARRLGDAVVERARRQGEWMSGVANGGETPGLMLGVSGVGLLFLGLRAPDRFRPVGLPLCASRAESRPTETQECP